MFSTDRRPGASLAASLLALAATWVSGCSSGPVRTECPDTTVVQGTECHLAADGSYYGDDPGITQDVEDRTADEIDEEANEESGIEPVEVEVIVIDKN